MTKQRQDNILSLDTPARAALTRFVRWFVEQSVPVWAERGFDARRGRFVEVLDCTGAGVDGADTRVRVQARQIYTFSKIARRGWYGEAEALAAAGFEFFLAHACPDGGARGCVHKMASDGAVIDDRRDLYDQAFLLLACSARWQAAKDERALALAERVIDFLDRELASPHGGWEESLQFERPRRQNPHMHLFEAFTALFEATGQEHYFQYARRIEALFQERIFDSNRGVVIEFFDASLQPDWPLSAGAVEPGHMAEWVWLLARFAALADIDRDDAMTQLFETARRLGRDDAGFLLDRISLTGANRSPTRRLWPQTEYLKALLSAPVDNGDTRNREIALLIARLFETYLRHETPGLWHDQFSSAGAGISRTTPASIVYHLYEAASEAARLLD